MPMPPLTPLSKEEILEGVARYPDWFYPFDLGQGVEVTPTGASIGKVGPKGFRRRNAPIWDAVLKACGGSLDGMSVLDAGCFQGYWSVEAARAGAERVLGFDLREEHIEQAGFVAKAIGLPNVEFTQCELFDLERLGEFDVVFLFGVLYHVDRPLELLARARKCAKKLIVVNTDVLPLDEPIVQYRYEDTGMEMNSATGNLVAIPSVSAVVRMLRHVGFGDVHVVKPPPAKHYQMWRRAVFIARPTADGNAEPPPDDVWARKGFGERKLEWVPSGVDRAPLRKILKRKFGAWFGGKRAPRTEANDPLADG